jgi:hypothetical protein
VAAIIDFAQDEDESSIGGFKLNFLTLDCRLELQRFDPLAPNASLPHNDSQCANRSSTPPRGRD